MLRLFLFCLLLSSQQLVWGQYPVILPHFLFEEMGKMDLEVPRIADKMVSSHHLPPISIKWSEALWKESSRDIIYIENISTQATLKRIWNKHQQPIPDSNKTYDYFSLKNNPQLIPEGFYKLSIQSSATIRNFKHTPPKIEQKHARPIEQWIYIAKESNAFASNKGDIVVIPKPEFLNTIQTLSFYATSTPPFSVTSYPRLNPTQSPLNNDHLITLKLSNNATPDSSIIQALEAYFEKKYKVKCPQNIAAATNYHFAINMIALDSLQRTALISSIESCDTLMINSYHIKWYLHPIKTEYADASYGGYVVPRSIALLRQNIRIHYFPSTDIYSLKKLLYKVGFTDIKQKSYGDYFYLEASYIGTMNIHQMNKNFQPLINNGHIACLQMVNF